MSRIGKIPVPLPKGVTATVSGSSITLKGPKGELSQSFHRSIAIAVDGGNVVVKRSADGKQERALHGLYRSLLKNMAVGVSAGFTQTLEVEGVGYNAKAEGGSKL